MNNTSNGYILQSAYTANGLIGSINELHQVFLAIYDTGMPSHTYTGRENIDITDNQISLNVPLKLNDEVVLNPRNYDGAVFEIRSGTDNFTPPKHIPWWCTNRTILLIYKSMHMSW